MDVEMRGNLLSLYFLRFAYKSLALLCYHTLWPFILQRFSENCCERRMVLPFPDGQIWFCRSLRSAPPEMREQRDRERETPQSFHDCSGVKMVQPSPPILRPVRQRVQRGARRRLWGRERREIESGTSHSLRERHEVRIWEATKGARHKRESHPFYNIFFVYHPYFLLRIVWSSNSI